MRNIYSICADEADINHKYTVEVNGIFMYKKNRTLEDSIKNFILEYGNSQADFNECMGAYRIHIIHEDEEVYFADNSGMMRYYVNQTRGKIYSSLFDAEEYVNRKPNYHAIAQFLSFGCIYNNETIVKSVKLSDPNLFYTVKNNSITEFDKKLRPLEELKSDDLSLKSLIEQAVSHATGTIGCTITGGVDSRSILANLLSVGVKPELSITGHDEQIDVKIAKEISDITGLHLRIVSDEIEENEWFENAIKAADGQEGICGIYRLDKLARHLQNSGIGLQFGGVAGELYKNSFINQDFPFYNGRPNWKRFYKFKVATFELPNSLFGKNLEEAIECLPAEMMDWLGKHKGRDKAEAYLNAGYEIMQARCNLVVNMFANYTTSYNPLMERKMATFAVGINPYSLEMQSFQRYEVTKKCPEIMNVKTDRNLTCNYNRRFFEFFKSYLYLFRVASQRLFYRNRIDIRVDKCFDVGLKHEKYKQSFDKLKGMGIIKEETDIEEVPIGLADRLFTVGVFFQ